MSQLKIWSTQCNGEPAQVKVGEEAEAFVIHADQETGDPSEPFVHASGVPVEFVLAKGQGEMLTSGDATGSDGSAFALFTPKTAGDFSIICYIGAQPPEGKIDGRTRLQYKGTATSDGKRKRVDTLRPFASAVPAPPPTIPEHGPQKGEHKPITSLQPEEALALLKPTPKPQGTRPAAKPPARTAPPPPPRTNSGVSALTRLATGMSPKPMPAPVAARPATVAPKLAAAMARPAKAAPKPQPTRPVVAAAAPVAAAATPAPEPLVTYQEPPQTGLPDVITITSLLSSDMTAPEPASPVTPVTRPVVQAAVEATSCVPRDPPCTLMTVPPPQAPDRSKRYMKIAIIALTIVSVTFIGLFIWDSTGPWKRLHNPATPSAQHP